jgi:uncharacterized protein with FMN-binding domain
MRRVILAILGTVSGLTMLLSFKTQPTATSAATLPAPVPVPAAAPSPTTTTTKEPEPTGSPAGAGTGTAGATTTTTTGSTKTVTGVAASTRYGPVQVQVTVADGRIASVEAVVYPVQSAKDRQINARAIPRLNQETLAANSAAIDTVSGATYTTRGYVISLQSALDQAGVA